ncbi:MAG TPA: hypothetical protein VFS08_01480 [Gemmatimonadaceae bacterium]|nr:hypothetical protein [Gemmatimonadaceae bacterium]
MGRRQQQHMGRSTEEGQELVGRDVRAGDPTAERANKNVVPMPNEEGTNFRADQPVDTNLTDNTAADAPQNEDLRYGGSGSRETQS